MLLAAVVFTSAGCEGFRFVTRGEYERLRSTEDLNARQAALITALTHDKERLTDEVNALRALLGTQGELIARLKKEADSVREEVARQPGIPALGGNIEVTQGPEGVNIGVGSDVLFAPGKVILKPEGEETLKRIVEVLRKKPNKLRICGYTDSQPIVHSAWESNFQLSGARALSVLDFLKEQGIDPARMHFAGYGEYDLRTNPDGMENMQKSRRVAIILLYDWATEVGKATAGAGVPK